jgi:hypothetical protein
LTHPKIWDCLSVPDRLGRNFPFYLLVAFGDEIYPSFIPGLSSFVLLGNFILSLFHIWAPLFYPGFLEGIFLITSATF